jgi:hypothetical protein
MTVMYVAQIHIVLLDPSAFGFLLQDPSHLIRVDHHSLLLTRTMAAKHILDGLIVQGGGQRAIWTCTFGYCRSEN